MAARPATTRNLFWLIAYLRPISSAAMNAIAKRKPPLPSFQERLNVSGYATSVKIIGVIRMMVAAMLGLMPKIV
jgi:hypothetical protein